MADMDTTTILLQMLQQMDEQRRADRKEPKSNDVQTAEPQRKEL